MLAEDSYLFGKNLFVNNRIYMDYAASTPVDKKVLRFMSPYWRGSFANPSSVHKDGVAAKKAVESAREKVANAIGAGPDEIIFTSGGTESNNLAIQGALRAFEECSPDNGNKTREIIISEIEHPSVGNCCGFIRAGDFRVSKLRVSEDGFISPKDVRERISNGAVIVSVVYVNNEIGTIQPIQKIARAINLFKKSNGAKIPYFHTDASQAMLYLDFNVSSLSVDMMSIDGQKIYGPKGVGALYVRRGVPISPIFFGGGQERGIRPGTENVPLIVGLGKAVELAVSRRKKESERIAKLRDFLWARIREDIPNAILNGSAENRVPNNLNISVPGADMEYMVFLLDEDGISASAGSACAGARGAEDGGIAVKLRGEKARGLNSLRLTLGLGSTKKDISRVAESIARNLKKFDISRKQ